MASNSFAESVINGTYKKSKQKQQNTSQSSNAFAESVIDGSYKKSKTINVSKEPTTTPNKQTINTINNSIIQTMGKSPTQTSNVNQVQPSTTPLVDNRASINPNASDNEKLRISANNNYNQKLALYEQASQAYKQKRDEELANRGISSDYISKFEDATPEQRLAKPTKEQVEQSASDARKYQAQREAIDEATKTEMDNAKFAQNQLKYAKYLKDYSDVQNEGVSLYDQTLGHVVRGAQDMFSTWTDDNRYIDENGNVQYLPTYNQMKEEQARNNTLLGNIGLDGLGKFLGDVGYQGAKVGTSIGLNALIPYAGSATYFTDIYADSYKDNINSGMDNEGAMVNAFAKAGQNYIKQRLLGGFGGKLAKVTGKDVSSLEKVFSKQWAKVATSPKVVAALSSMSAEAVDEFTDTYVEKAIDAVTRNDVSIGDVFSPDTFLEALYSGAVGGATGAIGGINPNSMAAAQQAINERLANQNIEQNTDAQIQAETPQIQTKPQDSINTKLTPQNVLDNPKTTNSNEMSDNLRNYFDLKEKYDKGTIKLEDRNNVISQLNELEDKLTPQERNEVYKRESQKLNTNNTNTQPNLEQTQLELNEADNNVQNNETKETEKQQKDIEQDLINEINNEQRKLDNGTSEDDGFHLAELQKELQEVQQKSIANDSNTFNLGKIDENNTLRSIRTKEDISNRKTNAYQYDNPEVKPYFKDAALDLRDALENYTTKGERWMRPDGTWDGTKFSSTPEITKLKDQYNMSYKDLDKGIDGIIKDKGAENNAASKKVELVIDDMLRNGYKSIDPNTSNPNQNYLDTLAGRPVDNQTNQQTEENPFADEEISEKPEWTKTRESTLKHMTDIANMSDGTNHQLTDKQKLDLINEGLEMGGFDKITELPGKEAKVEKQNDNIPERKSDSELLTIKKEETAKRIADDLNKSIKKDNASSQDFESLRKEIEKETGKPMRSYIETFTKGTGTTDLVKLMDNERITYDPTSKEKVTNEANKALNGLNYDEKIGLAKGIIHSDKRLKATDIAILTEVAKEANRLGKMNDVMELAQDMSMLETEGGQVVWAASLIKNSDPFSQLTMLRKIIDKEQSRGNKIYDGVKIKEDLVNKVVNSYNEDGTWNKETFDNAMDALKQDIVDQMKVRPTEKLNAWRYLSMLGNPKTHIRNVVANYAMMLLQGTKNKIASGIEAITPMQGLNNLLNTKISRKGLKLNIDKGNTEANRGHTLRRSTSEVKAYANETMENYFNENKQGSKYDENIGTLKSDLEKRRKMFRDRTIFGKGLNWANKKNSDLLEKEDVKFNKRAAKNAFANFLTANGIETKADIEANPDLVAQAKDYALFRGQEATFHQYSKTGEVLRNARESLKGGKGLETNYTMLNKSSSALSKGVGLLMDATMPFINTPVNIAKTGIEYTPGVGLLKTISDVKNAPKSLKADVLIDSLSKQFTGGVLAALGYGLAQAGILNGKSSGEKDEELEKNLGKQDYSVNILGNTFDLSWLSPSAMPLFVGVELYDTIKGKTGWSPESIMNLLAGTIDPLSEMSVISSVTQALQSYSKGTQALGDIGTSAITSYISQYIPTLSSQFATLFDDTQRNSSGNSLQEKIYNQVRYKLPFARNSLPAQVDVWGNEKKYAENPFIRFAEAFASPANRKEVKIDDTTKEIERVYDNTGSGLPSLKLTKAPMIDTDYYNLSSEEYIQYKKDYGKNAKDMLDDLMKQDDYKNADDVEKSKMISAIYEYSTYMAKKRIADENNLKFEYKKTNKKNSYNYPKYYLSLDKDDFAKYVAEKYIDYSE